jgi:PAS domain S-box-containing protein
VLDAVPLGIVVIDRDELVVYANTLAGRLLGERLQLGRRCPWSAPSYPPPDAGVEDGIGGFQWGAAHAEAAIVPSATGGMLRPMTIALAGNEGLAMVVLTAVSPTDKSHLDRDPGEQLREVEAIARLGSWSWDVEEDVMTWSDESYRLFGLTPTSVPTTYEDVRQRMHPENRGQSEEVIERCRRTGQGFAYTRRVVLPDGSVRWHQGRAQPVMSGGRVVRIFGTVQDVTDRINGKEALRESLEPVRELTHENKVLREALRAEVEAQLDEVAASRARVVHAADKARRQVERDLHDGAQQRLTTVGLILRAAQAQLDPGAQPSLERALDQAVVELQEGLSELRTLARGLHPTILTDEGLVPALRSLAARSPLSVYLHAPPLDALPEPVEAAAYFLVAEGLTNVAKHAAADSARVVVKRDEGILIVEVADDGAGGAVIADGSGLLGLSDRVAALGGRVQLHSPFGGGTRLRAELPCA